MRLTKGQLKRIIRESFRRLHEMRASDDSFAYEVLLEEADNAWNQGVRRFPDFWKSIKPWCQENGYDLKDAQQTCREIWAKTKANYRRTSRYDNWSAWD